MRWGSAVPRIPFGSGHPGWTRRADRARPPAGILYERTIMRFAIRSRSVRNRAAAAAVAAMLWSGLSPGALPAAEAAEGRSAAPGMGLAWGSNDSGQLGDGATAGRSTTPVRVCGDPPCTSPLDRVIAIDGGQAHTLALRADGTVWSWGSNISGQLGNGTTIDRSTQPEQVCAVGETAPCSSFLTGVKAVSAGYAHSLALRSDGTVVSWGLNLRGILGDGTYTDRNTPVRVCASTEPDPCTRFLSGVTSISAGSGHSLATLTDGTVRSWGSNFRGELGDGTSDDNSNVPVKVCAPGRTAPCTSFLTGVTSVSAGIFAHSLATLSNGTAWAWGSDERGELGNGNPIGTSPDRNVPVQVCAPGQTAPCTSFLTGVASVSAGYAHSLATLSNGTAWAWGYNNSGQLGNGTRGNGTDRNVPVQVCAPGQTAPCTSFLTGVSSVSAGFTYSLASLSNGAARAWGYNNSGQLGNGTSGDGTDSSVPVQVCAQGQSAPCGRFLDGIGAVSAGDSHGLAIARPLADVAVDISSSPDSVRSGSNVTYTVTVRNNGPTLAENVVLNDTLPPGGRFVSATPSQGTCTVPSLGSSDTVTCRLSALGSGQQATVQIVVRAVTAANSTVTNKAAVSSSTPDSNEINNSASIDTSVRF
ncbi:hypothetical protein ACFRJ1_11390 [Streptomyces sp. NPDC056773]|uniref:RCC1 domain-containing protein n=1 Tax=unclassified Streptomyces TaxID=2593676 RepID=UPI0036A21563